MQQSKIFSGNSMRSVVTQRKNRFSVGCVHKQISYYVWLLLHIPFGNSFRCRPEFKPFSWRQPFIRKRSSLDALPIALEILLYKEHTENETKNRFDVIKTVTISKEIYGHDFKYSVTNFDHQAQELIFLMSTSCEKSVSSLGGANVHSKFRI